MHRCLGARARDDGPGRDRRVKIGQGLRVGEATRHLRDESLDKLKHAVGPVDEAIEELVGIGRRSRGIAPRRASVRREDALFRSAATRGRSGNIRASRNALPRFPRTVLGRSASTRFENRVRKTGSADNAVPQCGLPRRKIAQLVPEPGAVRC